MNEDAAQNERHKAESLLERGELSKETFSHGSHLTAGAGGTFPPDRACAVVFCPFPPSA